jgi:hypothetical protein
MSCVGVGPANEGEGGLTFLPVRRGGKVSVFSSGVGVIVDDDAGLGDVSRFRTFRPFELGIGVGASSDSPSGRVGEGTIDLDAEVEAEAEEGESIRLIGGFLLPLALFLKSKSSSSSSFPSGAPPSIFEPSFGVGRLGVCVFVEVDVDPALAVSEG